jgi:tRNA (guanine-N7-)-methyltransferase
VILEWAARDPRAAYVGLDWKFKQIHRGAEKAAKRGISNLLFFRSNSERLHFMFGPSEIDFLYLYFPDPWAKKSQLKNRWFTSSRLEQVAPLVRPGGVFHVKTDHAGYFDWMLEHAGTPQAQALWDIQDVTRDLHAGNPLAKKLSMPEVTLFEKLFIAQGKPVHSMKLVRREQA